MEKSRGILKQVWGYDSFRPLQEEIVDNVIYGHDTLAVLPTGGGKSICFQVPALALSGITIVITPLIALMQDQVDNLRKRGIKAELITSGMSYREIDIILDNCRFGDVKLLYTSPERLKSELFIERFKLMNVSLIVVDEAHCISEWGHDFRPAYRDIAELRDYHPEIPLIALTASATLEVQDDILRSLNLRQPKIIKGSLERANLSYRVMATENKAGAVLAYCKDHDLDCGIIYCQTRRSVKEITRYLRTHNLRAGMYHGGMTADDRKFMLENWMNGNLRIMVATNAFGMGIDKPDVRYVLHFEFPSSLEAYYQEAGRAGRDEKSAVAIAFWDRNDPELKRDQIEKKYPEPERIKQIYEAVCNFLKVAIGSGLDERYAFDIQNFSKLFHVPISETYNALRILENNGNIRMTEGNFLPTRVRFAIGSSAIYKFQVAHDSIAGLITLLSRSYPGIYDRFVNIDEKELAKRLKISSDELRRQLEFLETHGIMDVQLQSSKPQITFPIERLPATNLVIANEVYANRIKMEKTKLEAMIEYITSEHCRSELISAYFGAPTRKCGKCDVCMAEKTESYSFNEVLELLPHQLPATISQLIEKTNISKELLQRALHNLVLEEKVVFEDRIYRINS